MKKRAFTLVEVVVAFAIFLIAFIPLNQITRNNTRLINRGELEIVKTIGPSGGFIQNEDELYDSIMEDLKQQAEWAGYNFLKDIIDNHSGTRTYTFSSSSVRGCDSPNVHLNSSGPVNIDKINMDPFQGNMGGGVNSTDYRCYISSNFETSPSGKTIKLTLKMGKVKNFRTLPNTASDIAIPSMKSSILTEQPFIYGTLEFDNRITRDFVITPFQERCFSF